MKLSNAKDHGTALKLIEVLMNETPNPETCFGDFLVELADAVQQYEAVHFNIGEPTPAEAAAFRKEQETRTE
jgi:antitoxin component HigA of HigAB toxin-antitoxin module